MLLHENREFFAEAINLSAYKTGLSPEAVEKDYYVTMVLRKLAERFDFIVFKGGTSLSKCHRVISRFSEDIDITTSRNLSQGEKRRLKYGIVDIADELGLRIANIDDTHSRRDYNCYELVYESVTDRLTAEVSSDILLETSFSEYSFPTVTLPVNSYIGEMFDEEAPEEKEGYLLDDFSMQVQSVERTLIDKVFAVCDYYMKGQEKKHSRHIYDIYKLLPLVSFDDSFASLVREVRAMRAGTHICPSAQDGIDISQMIGETVANGSYKEDYAFSTTKLLAENVPYELAVCALRKISEQGVF